MRILAKLNAVEEIIAHISHDKNSISNAINYWHKKNRFAGSSDRFYLYSFILQFFRIKGSLSYLFPDNQFSQILACYKFIYGVEKFNELFLIKEKYGEINLSEAEKNKIITTDVNQHLEKNFSIVFIDNLKKTFLDENEYKNILASLLMPAPLDLRVVNDVDDVSDVHEIDFDKYYCQNDLYEKKLLRIFPTYFGQKMPNIENNITKGKYEVQDLASQIAMRCVPPYADNVLDYCAGACGKSLSFALNFQKNIVIYDINKQRLENGIERLGKLNLKFHILSDAEKENISNDNLHDEKKFSLIIADVPCTLSGTYRRKVLEKYNLSSNDLENIIKEQANILREIKPLLRDDGFIIYITCSLLDCENDTQIEKFLGENKSYKPCDVIDFLQKNNGDIAKFNQSPMTRIEKFDYGDLYNYCKKFAFVQKKYGILLTPYHSNSDGLYISILKKN